MTVKAKKLTAEQRAARDARRRRWDERVERMMERIDRELTEIEVRKQRDAQRAS